MLLSWAMLGFLCTGSFLCLLSSEKLWEKSEKDHSRLCPWECLIFVQMWPSSFCVNLVPELNRHWPTFTNLTNFQFCNFSTGCMAEPPAGISPYHPCRAQRGIFYVPPNLKDPRHPCP
ncbi:hypothetical protein E2320_000852 [Naja naja]|nr:hypothetical protein E2320_000852 [Naja naja]